ncbi:thiol-disulfide oxidoreductase ResA [Ammoniphilus sp. CFH 90114]|uniref:thiol-disulfide oxidoreductase ResA n=1 Tax=Ammoniphilus sp. CFH 90114 TaxID=2493665 RepID=UPI00100F29B2|nr:thiol-disulfide oxidoreductase ResA [Ammoniphilus sp. CFH 90114]RXT13854.1 thiol-disulfide oxidoreductase ResA [Ammoniphilus sp. CFH 90114]
MNRTRTITRMAILAVIFIGIAVALYNGFVKDKSVVKTGELAPDFVLQTLDGERFQLSDYRGKGIVLNFWGTWCQPCEAEMPDLEEAHKKYKDQGVMVVGLNIRQPEVTVRPFVERYNLTFPIVMDRTNEITQLYEIGPIPTTYFIDPKGVVKKIVIGGPMSEETIVNNIKLIVPE